MTSPVSPRIKLISAATPRARSRSRTTPRATPVTTISAITTYMMGRPMGPIIANRPSNVEKLYSSSVYAVLRADDCEAIACDPPLEQRGAVSQVMHRRLDVGPRGTLG